MKTLNKTILTTSLLAIFMLGQPAFADSADHNAAAPGISISHDKHHENKDAVFGDEANHEGYSGGHSATSESHGESLPQFSSAEHQAIKKLIFGDIVGNK